MLVLDLSDCWRAFDARRIRRLCSATDRRLVIVFGLSIELRTIQFAIIVSSLLLRLVSILVSSLIFSLFRSFTVLGSVSRCVISRFVWARKQGTLVVKFQLFSVLVSTIQ